MLTESHQHHTLSHIICPNFYSWDLYQQAKGKDKNYSICGVLKVLILFQVIGQSKRPIVKRKIDIQPSLQLINVNHTCFPIRSHVSSPQDMCHWHSLKTNIWVVYWSHPDYTLFRLARAECWLCTGTLKALSKSIPCLGLYQVTTSNIQHPTQSLKMIWMILLQSLYPMHTERSKN